MCWYNVLSNFSFLTFFKELNEVIAPIFKEKQHFFYLVPLLSVIGQLTDKHIYDNVCPVSMLFLDKLIKIKGVKLIPNVEVVL